MKIVLVTDRSKHESAIELTFEKPLIRFGRDKNQCDIAYDNKDFRMVSRNHAEIRYKNGKFWVLDVGSSFGTFLNGQKVVKPVPLAVGNSIQLGAEGPKAHVIWIESGPADEELRIEQKASARTPSPKPPPAPPAPPERAAPPPPPPPPPSVAGSVPGSATESPSAPKPAEKKVQSGPAVLTLLDDKGERPFTVSSNSVWIGRDPKADIVIDASAVMVSRRHAEVRRQNGKFELNDNNSFNGTLVNGQRVSAPTPLFHEDRIQLGMGGPVLRFDVPGSKPGASQDEPAAQRSVNLDQPSVPGKGAHDGTMVLKLGEISGGISLEGSEYEQLLMQVSFGDRDTITIGRDEANDIRLDGLQISNKHARLRRTSRGVGVEDLNSTNGIYINGERATKKLLGADDAVRIGAFVVRVDDAGNVAVYDTRSKTRVDALNISMEVRNRAGRGKIRLLDDISLSISPNEFIGLLGTSGAGKSTLMNALSGMKPATEGSVFVNNLDLYRYIDSLKQSIGFVPQDDIIHRELSVYRTLYYVAKLRLSRDVSNSEIDQIIDEVLDVTGLAERRDVAVSQLSGGQRKRVSMAVELITKPSVIFLDEPTSGLDPSTEEKIMKLFRQIAESGRTVILTTHAMENVRLFDKIVLLMRGKVVFYGTPTEALAFVGASNFKDLFDKLEEEVEAKVDQRGESERPGVTEEISEKWRSKYRGTALHKQYIERPLGELGSSDHQKFRKSRSIGIFGAVRQLFTLTGRYARVLLKDKFTLAILFAQAPIIAFMVYITMGSQMPRDFAYFALALCAMWFGTSVAAREIVRERKIYERERMVNLGILPYLGSKLLVLGFIVSLQCLFLFVPLQFLNLTGLMPMPGLFLGITQFITMLLTAAVGIATGLLVSTIVRTSEMATSLVPLILIPQIVFSGLIGVPEGINRVVGLTMPATWSFDTMKQFSTLDTLEPEGALRSGDTEGKGLYKFVEGQNEQVVERAKKNIKDYEADLEARLKEAEKRANSGERVEFSGMPDRPKVEDPVKVPEDLSRYVTFLHPWMHPILNQFVLVFMFSVLLFWTVAILRLRDFG